MQPPATLNIHLLIEPENSSIPFLSIPLTDAHRLSKHPLKWIRFVMFCICGVRGDLYTKLGDEEGPVDYTSVDVEGVYYYKPEGPCTFIDPHNLHNTPTTSSILTNRGASFREKVIKRDGHSCVFTGERGDLCDAVHLIGRSKGSEYVKRVVESRRALYEPPSSPSDYDIDSIENGILLSKALHVSLRRGDIAFLKTPNFALSPSDIPRWESDPLPPTRITLQRLKANERFNSEYAGRYIEWSRENGYVVDREVCYRCGLGVDGVFRGEGGEGGEREEGPPAIILDYVYGVAAYRLWRSPAARGVLEKYQTRSSDIPISPHSHLDAEETPAEDLDNSSSSQPRSETREEDQLADAMDEMNLLLMLLHGKTPEGAAREWEERMKEEDKMSREAGREKVRDWLQSNKR